MHDKDKSMHFGNLSDLSDEKLAKLAADGNDESMAILISRISPLARAHAASKYGSSVEFDDLAQEGMIGFLNAVSTYDESKGASFRTYAVSCINNRMISAIRRNSKKSNIPQDSVIYIEDGDFYRVEDCSDPQDVYAYREEDVSFSEMLDNTLSELERKVAALYIDGHSYKDIAAFLGISDKSVDNAIQRIKKKLKL